MGLKAATDSVRLTAGPIRADIGPSAWAGPNGPRKSVLRPLFWPENNPQDGSLMTEIVSGAGRPRAGLGGIRPAHRIWLEDEGLPVFGVGISELLKRVEATGSLRCAASDMGMAYSKAWQIVRRAEDHLGFKLMTRRTGGRGGGCSIVSEDGIRLFDAFDAYARDAELLLAELFATRFGEWSDALGDMSSDRAAASQVRGE